MLATLPTLFFGLTISSFHGNHAQRMFPCAPPPVEDLITSGSVQPLNRGAPSVLIALFDDDDVFCFLHHNYTLTRCAWPRPMLTMQKVVVFKEVARHLKDKFDQRVRARLGEADDRYAWTLSVVPVSDL